jgi:hypothetical protein
MGDGTKESPYTRDDVLKLIEEHGGKAEGLDLSWQYFKKRINLNQINLEGIILNNTDLRGANIKLSCLSGGSFNYANLSDANFNNSSLKGVHFLEANLFSTDFTEAYLEDSNFNAACLIATKFENANLKNACLDNADLMGANLEGTKLIGAHLKGANLFDAHLSGVYLSDVQFNNDTNFQDVNWGNYIIGEECREERNSSSRVYSLHMAEVIYRRFKIWYSEHGIYDIAGKFFYREMESRRKAQSWKKPHLKLWNWIMRLLCGYGERPERVVISSAAVIFVLALVYYLWCSFNISSFLDTLYYSAVSFTAVGYGNWAPQPTDWAKGMGVTEALLGVFMMALFLVTFTRKMTR